MRRSLYLFVILFSFYTASYSQEVPDVHRKIISAYDRIEINSKETESTDDIKRLYKQSKEINFPEGALRALILLQRIGVMKNDYILSGKYGDEAELLAGQLKDYNSLSIIHLSRGKINIILDKLPEAEASLKIALKYSEQIENDADRHIQICRIYANYAGMYEGLNNFKGWYKSTKKSLNVIETTPVQNLTEYQKSKYYYLYIFELMNMGSYYVYGQKPPNFKLAEPYFKRALNFQNTNPEYFRICNIDVYYAVSGFYLEKGDHQQSIDYAHKLIEAEKSKNSPRDRLFAYNNIKNAYRFLNNPVEENKYLRLYTALNDSINLAEKKTIVHQSREEIKKSDVKNQQSTRSLLWAGSAVILVIALGSWFFVHRKNKTLRRNYEQIIEKLKQNALDPAAEVSAENEETDDYKEIEPEANKESGLPSNRIVISIETETRILKRLLAFEKSEKFLRKDFSLGLLAAQLNTNSKYLSEVIKNNRAQNFNNYINTLRINYIVRKLYNEPKYREYKISYLAEECGYASSQVFVIAFKKINGVTPSYFIDSLKEDQSLVYS